MIRRWIWILMVTFPCLAQAVDGEMRNGGDGIGIGGIVKAFAKVEYSEPFIPQNYKKSWNIIDIQLRKIAKHLPRSAAYLESMFIKGRLSWFLVEAKLKDVKDEGDTAIVLNVNKEQLAVNEGNVVQIRKDLWEKMDDVNKAYCIVHEALEVANGKKSYHSAKQVRSLVGLFFDKNIDQYSSENLARTIKLIFEQDASDQSLLSTSRFYRLVSFELDNLGSRSSFQVEEVYTSKTSDLIVHYKAKEEKNSLIVSSFNPDRSMHALLIQNGLLEQMYANESFPSSLDELCKPMEFANRKEWRLPTQKELWRLYNASINRVRYLSEDVSLTVNGGFFKLSDGFLFPQGKSVGGIYVISDEGKILNFGKQLADESNYNGYLQLLCVHNIAQGEKK